MRKIFIRSGIVGFWLVLLFVAFYGPRWTSSHFPPNSINIFAWGDILDPAVIAEFEKETGIKVQLNYYSSNEELLVKLKATKGEDYDLVIPTDYAVSLLIHEGLLKELDKSKILFYDELNPLLMGHHFDPQNRYSIPFEWEIYGLGYNKELFKEKPLDPSWKAIFDERVIDYKIAMVNDPIDAVLFSSFYLFGAQDRLNAKQIEEMKQLLFTQKKWVEAYASFRGDYFLATKNCAVTVSSSSYIWRSKHIFDFIGFAVPKEGTFISIESLCIPAQSKKEHLVYELINYLFTPASVQKHFETFGFFPALVHPSLLHSVDAQMQDLMQSSLEQFQKYHFTKLILPPEQLQNLWVELKSHSH